MVLGHRHRDALASLTFLFTFPLRDFSLEFRGLVEEGPRVGARRLVAVLLPRLVSGVAERPRGVGIPRVAAPELGAHGFNLLGARSLGPRDLNLVPFLHSLDRLNALHFRLFERGVRGGFDLPHPEAPFTQRAAFLSTKDGPGVDRVSLGAVAHVRRLFQLIHQSILLDRSLPLGIPQLVR